MSIDDLEFVFDSIVVVSEFCDEIPAVRKYITKREDARVATVADRIILVDDVRLDAFILTAIVNQDEVIAIRFSAIPSDLGK